MTVDLEFDAAFRKAVCAPKNRGGLAVAASHAAVALECAHEIHGSRASEALLAALADYSQELGRDPDPSTKIVLHSHLQHEVYRHFTRPVTISAPEEKLTRLRAYAGFALAEALVHRKQIPAEFMHAVSMVQRSSMGGERGSREWREVANALPATPEDVDKLLLKTHDPVVLAFLADLKGILSRSLVPDRSLAAEASEGITDQEGSPDAGFPVNAEDPDAEDQEDEGTEAADGEFHGDLLGWQSRRAEFSSYRDVMGLDVAYGRIPPQYLPTITGRLSVDLGRPGAEAKDAKVALWSMLLGAQPSHAFQVGIHDDSDGRSPPDASLYISTSGHIVWRLDVLLDEAPGSEPRYVRIPVPKRLFDACNMRGQCASTLNELLDVPGMRDKDERASWLRGYRRYLASIGEAIYPVTPARLAYSFGAVCLSVTGQDLLSAAMSLNFALVPRSAFFYTYVGADQIVSASTATYDLLELGPPCELPQTYLGFGSRNALSRQELDAGWNKLLDATACSWSRLQAAVTPQEICSAWGELVKCNLLRLCTAQGRRTTRLARITFGSLLALEDVTFEADKDALESPSERLLPKTPAIRAAIDWQLACVTLLARKLVSLGVRDESVVAMASGVAAYHRAAFFGCEITYMEGVPYLYRSSISSGDLDSLALECFGRMGNVGRHFWSTELHRLKADLMLRRVLTRHLRRGAEIDHSVMTMSVRVVVAELGRVMHQVAPLADKLPAHGVPEPIVSVRELPLPRTPLTLARVNGAPADGSAPRLVSRSPAAIRLIELIRAALLAGDGPDDWAARVRIHLLVFVGISDLTLIDQAVADPDLHFKRLGKAAVLRECRGTREICYPIPEPTLQVLADRPAQQDSITPAGATFRIALWLCKTFRAEWDRKNELRAWSQLVVCFSHWAAYYLPSSLNSAYAIRDQAPALNLCSLLRLAGELTPNDVQHFDGMTFAPHICRQPRNAVLGQLAKAVHAWGDDRKKLDETARARGLQEDLKAIDLAPTGSPSEVTRMWVEKEVEKALEPDGSEIQISSLSTYFSNLRATLESIPSLEDMRTWGAEEFDDLCTDLRASVRANGRTPQARAARAAAVERKLDAAARMMLVLHEEGYRVPAWVLRRFRRESNPALFPAASVLIRDEDVVRADKLLSLAAAKREWLDQELKALMHAQHDLGCRTSEVDLLELQCVLKGTNLVVIRPVGFSHIKRKASIRLASASTGTLDELSSLGVFRHDYKPGARHLFLGDDETLTDHARELNAMVAGCLRVATADPHASQYSLRGGAMTRRAFPGWEELAHEHFAGQAGPQRCREFFAYEARKWLAPTRASSEAGHSGRWRFLLSYFAAWPILRGLALAATLPARVPTAYIRSSGVSTPGALATNRHSMVSSGSQFDEWLWIARRRPALRLEPLLALHSATTHTVPANSVKPAQDNVTGAQVLYLAGRLMGLSSSIAAVQAKLDTQHQDLLEKSFRAARVPTDLRSRVRAGATAGASKADRAGLSADHVKLWLSGVENLDLQGVELLHELLVRDAHNRVDWEAVGDAKGAVEKALQVLPICLGVRLAFGERRLTNPVSTALQLLPRVEVASHRDYGNPPAVFVIHASKEERTSVSRARLTVLYKVLTFAYLLLRLKE